MNKMFVIREQLYFRTRAGTWGDPDSAQRDSPSDTSDAGVDAEGHFYELGAKKCTLLHTFSRKPFCAGFKPNGAFCIEL